MRDGVLHTLNYALRTAMWLHRYLRSAGPNGVVAAAVSWGSATVLVHQLPSPLGVLPAMALLAAVVAVWWWARWRWLLWFAVGALWTTVHIHARLADWLPAERQGGDFAVTGWVDGFPNHSTGAGEFLFSRHNRRKIRIRSPAACD